MGKKLTHLSLPLARTLLSLACAAAVVSLAACASDSSGEEAGEEAILLVGERIQPNPFGIVSAYLEAKDNALGEGTFVYVPRASLSDDIPFVVWLVVGEDAYPLGIPAKLATPSFPCPCTAPHGFWEAAGINPYRPSDSFEEVVLGRVR